MIKSYPKIFAIGSRYIKNILDDEVIVEEKIDGSMFAFGWIDGTFYMRSKNSILYPESCDNMFRSACDVAMSIKDRLNDNVVYYGEYLNKPKHNAIKYDRTPINHISLFGMHDLTTDTIKPVSADHASLVLCFEIAPVLHIGKLHPDALKKFLDTESFLGGAKIEGVVVKNYNKSFVVGDVPFQAMFGKFVSEEFKEINSKLWKSEKPNNRIESYYESFRTEARWNKAFQHLRDRSMIDYDPKDIGKIIKEVRDDIQIEEKENIMEWLLEEHIQILLKTSTRGLAEWYKEKLMEDRVENMHGM